MPYNFRWRLYNKPLLFRFDFGQEWGLKSTIMQAALKISPENYATYQVILGATQIFHGCKNDLVSEFISNSSIKSFTKGELIYNFSDKADWFYLVLKGYVKLYRETMDGNEAVIDVIGENGFFGKLAMFENFLYQENCEATEHTELLRLPLGLLSQKVEDVPRLALNLLKHGSAVKKQKTKEIEHLSLQNASQRIGCFLLNLCGNAKSNSITLHLPYDKIVIAAKLGMQPETFSRALTKLQSSTSIEVRGSSVEISNISELSQFCCNSCSSSFPCKS